MHKPGCFGSASIYSADSDVCRACPASGECAGAALETLKRIRATVNVDALIARHRQARPLSPAKPPVQTATQQAAAPATPAPVAAQQPALLLRVLNALPERDRALVAGIKNTKAQQIAVTLLANGELSGAAGRLAKGQPAMSTGRPKWLAEHFAAVQAQGVIDRIALRQHMERAMQWNTATAEAHASMFIAIAAGLRLVGFDGKTIKIRKDQ